MKMRRIIIILSVFLLGCTSTKKVFSSLEKSVEDNYGYSINNPILIGEFSNWQKNADLSLFYISKLTYNQRPLQYILHATVEKPMNQPRKKKSIPLRFGVPSSLEGKFLDLYVVVPIGTTDTLKLYFDEEIKGTLKIPKGFEFDINQSNNIYR
ncbi:MAG: hypothetical protein H6Q20_378 [Bacteroidetes bacterium]|nr:hypothetical protein [Bacteroidota bacterium]